MKYFLLSSIFAQVSRSLGSLLMINKFNGFLITILFELPSIILAMTSDNYIISINKTMVIDRSIIFICHI